MKRKFGTAFMFVGAALVLAALSLFLWNSYEDKQAGIAAEEILSQVAAEIPDDDKSTCPTPYDDAMTEVEIDGYLYIGYISIPALELELPVMSEWDYTRLKIAPCRYTGSTKSNDLIIAAHNYTRHFGNLKSLSVGDTMYFTDMDGIVSTYEVAEMDILAPTAIEEMTNSGYALTLFTCTYGGASRVTVRCERTN